jgi:hypothetical protein
MNWQTVKKFGEVRLFNFTLVLMAFPLLALIIRELNENGLKTIVFPDDLKYLYGVSLCYFLVMLIYNLVCPKIIKEYKSQEDFIHARQKLLEASNPDKKYEIILTNLSEDQKIVSERLIELRKLLGEETLNHSQKTNATAEYNKLIEQHYSSCIQRNLVREFKGTNSSRKVGIAMAMCLYLLATGIFLYLLIGKASLVFNS